MNSSLILSQDTISILNACLLIEIKQLLSILNPSFDIKYAALIILKGSSENVSSGSKGVFNFLDLISLIPPKGSISSPKLSGCILMAIALIVKSLLSKSSSKLERITFVGFLELFL